VYFLYGPFLNLNLFDFFVTINFVEYLLRLYWRNFQMRTEILKSVVIVVVQRKNVEYSVGRSSLRAPWLNKTLNCWRWLTKRDTMWRLVVIYYYAVFRRSLRPADGRAPSARRRRTSSLSLASASVANTVVCRTANVSPSTLLSIRWKRYDGLYDIVIHWKARYHFHFTDQWLCLFAIT